MMTRLDFVTALSSLRTKVSSSRIGLPQPVDQAVDRARFLAALGTQNERSLAGERREGDAAVAILGDFLGERGLAGAGIAEEPEQLRLAAFQPFRDGF